MSKEEYSPWFPPILLSQKFRVKKAHKLPNMPNSAKLEYWREWAEYDLCVNEAQQLHHQRQIEHQNDQWAILLKQAFTKPNRWLKEWV